MTDPLGAGGRLPVTVHMPAFRVAMKGCSDKICCSRIDRDPHGDCDADRSCRVGDETLRRYVTLRRRLLPLNGAREEKKNEKPECSVHK